jgi:hypothetical protein
MENDVAARVVRQLQNGEDVSYGDLLKMSQSSPQYSGILANLEWCNGMKVDYCQDLFP